MTEKCITCGRSDAEYLRDGWTCNDPWHSDAHLRAKSKQSSIIPPSRRPSLEQQVNQLIILGRCERSDLRRFRNRELYRGELSIGMIFEWEPDNPFAAETCEVIRITDRAPDPDKWIVTRGTWNPGEFGNDESRFREAVVKSLIKILPRG